VDQPVPAPEATDPADPERHPPRWSAPSRAAVLTGLLGLALTQPLLDLMGRNPAFFVAGSYTSGQIIAFGLIVALVPPVVVVAAVLLAGRLHRSAGDILYQVVVFGIGGVFGNVFARGIDLEGGKVALASGLLGGALALAIVRWRPGRMLLEYLAVANVFFLVAFLFMSPTSDLISGAGGVEAEIGRVSLPTPPGPVVVIVFDELPVSTLLETDGTINADRYPAFARLAESSTWWRNASSSHHRTERAVPELLTGTITAVDALPSYVDLPRNLLTMFSSIPVERYEPITDMCPRSQCEARVMGELDQMLYDASVVYGHRVFPRRLRNELPAIDQAWGGFGEVGGDGSGAPAATGDLEKCREDAEARGEDAGRLCKWFSRSVDERSPAAQVAALESLGADIGTEPTLHFAHVVLPHAAWTIDPWGHRLMGAVAPAPDDEKNPADPSDPSYEWLARLQYQRHSLQVGAADAALGSVLDDIEASGAWDDTTLVVMADHGTSVLPPTFGRDTVNEDTVEEIHRVPLFIKAPGVAEGEVVDDPALAIDMVPTLADVLDVDLDWEFDGHSLLDGSEPTVEPLVSKDVQALFDLVERHHAQIPNGDDWVGLAKVGEHADLVGTPLEDHDVGAPSDLRWSADGEDQFDSLPTDAGEAPQVLNGSVAAPGDERPPELVVSVNGTIAGVIGGYYRSGSAWRFSTVLGPYLRDGANEIVAYEVDGDVLRPLQ
jgi:hypothetical protein